MKRFPLVTKSLLFSVVLVFSVSNQSTAASISFGGASASDGSGLTSTFMDPINGGLSDYFIETFDIATGNPLYPGSTDYTVSGFENECAVNSLNNGPIGIDVTANSSEIAVRKGSVTNVAAAPANDTTCYGYATNNGQGTATISFDYNNLLDYYSSLYGSSTQLGITYLGFYWGSVDVYNDFYFYSGGSLISSITGAALLSQLGGSSGNQTSPDSNAYVNIAFSIAEQFDTLVINTSDIAGEFDNIVIGLSTREIPVSAPGATLILLFGTVMLAVRRSRKS
ncbi:MAG: PEP-CTERM sorting domain-containing protein [Pseudomonadota bacterium]|nr:PEP-CTERM sorting domain-containing protein [Pseudomonadota bacterium]